MNGDGGCRHYGYQFGSNLFTWTKRRRSPGSNVTGVNSTNKPAELLQWLCHDDSTIYFNPEADFAIDQ